MFCCCCRLARFSIVILKTFSFLASIPYVQQLAMIFGLLHSIRQFDGIRHASHSVWTFECFVRVHVNEFLICKRGLLPVFFCVLWFFILYSLFRVVFFFLMRLKCSRTYQSLTCFCRFRFIAQNFIDVVAVFLVIFFFATS